MQNKLEEQDIDEGSAIIALPELVSKIKNKPELKGNLLNTFVASLCIYGKELEEKKEIEKLFELYTTGFEIYPENTDILNNFASHLFRLGYIKQAKDYYLHIFNLKNTLDSLRNLENVYNYLVERWHYRMLNDYNRNNSFKSAITKKIKSGFNKVLDIGTGTGLLSLYAKDAGAKEIYACDCSETMIDIAKQVFDSNNVKNDIELLPMLSTDIQIQRDLPQRVNLVVTETMDCGLLGEHVLQTLNHAWEHLLLPPCPSNVPEKQKYGSVIPLGASIYIATLQSDHIRLGNTVLTPYLNFLGINNKVRAYREEPYDTINYKMLPGHSEILSEGLDVFNVNFNDPNDIKSILNGEKRTSVKMNLNKTGRIDAIIAWFKLHLDEDISLSSAPDTNSCWEQAVFPLPSSLDVKENDDIELEISCKNGKLTVNVQEDNKDEFLLLSEAAIRFLNDAHYINSLLSAVIQNSHENVLDMNPFPIIGLYLLKKGLTKLVCSIGVVNNADKGFLEKESSLLLLNSIEDITELGYYVEFDLIILHPISTSGEINNENLSTLEFIKKEDLLSINCQILPLNISLWAQIIESDWIKNVTGIHNDAAVHGYNISRFINEYRVSQQLFIHSSSLPATVISKPIKIIDIKTIDIMNLISTVKSQVEVTKEGKANAVIYWFNIQWTSDNSTFSNNPYSHLCQAASLFSPKEIKIQRDNDTVTTNIHNNFIAFCI